jgi:hypothetical protein
MDHTLRLWNLVNGESIRVDTSGDHAAVAG